VRANPPDRRATRVHDAIGHAHFFIGDHEKAIEVSDNGLHMDPSLQGANAQLGRFLAARAAIDGLLKLIPRFSLRGLERNPRFIAPDLVRELTDSMRLAGQPEKAPADS